MGFLDDLLSYAVPSDGGDPTSWVADATNAASNVSPSSGAMPMGDFYGGETPTLGDYLAAAQGATPSEGSAVSPLAASPSAVASIMGGLGNMADGSAPSSAGQGLSGLYDQNGALDLSRLQKLYPRGAVMFGPNGQPFVIPGQQDQGALANLPEWAKGIINSPYASLAYAGLQGLSALQNYRNALDDRAATKARNATIQGRQDTTWQQSQAPISVAWNPDYSTLADTSGIDFNHYGTNAAGSTKGVQFYANPKARANGNIAALSPAPRKDGGLAHLARGGQPKQSFLPAKIQGQPPLAQALQRIANLSNRKAMMGGDPVGTSAALGQHLGVPMGAGMMGGQGWAQPATGKTAVDTGVGADEFAARGGLIRNHYAAGGRGPVPGGQTDNVPAMLSPGEYVMDADSVSSLGDGDTQAGAAKLDQMRRNIRSHKRAAPVSGIPPKAKNPLAYLKGAK